MAIMTKMRDSMPVILFALVILFLITIVFDWGMNYLGLRSQGQNPVIATVNGRDITYQEFNQIVERARENQKAQTGKDIEEDQIESFRQQVWDVYLNQILVEQQIEKWGIKVTDDEIRNIILGENPPDFLKRNFIDSLGNFNRSIYEQALMDPRNKEALIQAEDAVKQQQLQEKLNSLVSASVVITEGEVKNKFYEQNVKAEAQYILFDPNLIPDNKVTVTDDDLQKYYEENLDKYKVEASRKLKYVIFREQPTKSDSEAVYKGLLAIAEEAKGDSDFASLVKIYSAKPYEERAIRHGSLPKPSEKILYEAKVGSVVGPIQTYEGYSIFKILRDSATADEYVSASHILINFGGDTTSALNKAKSIISQLKSGADFATLAKQYSQDPGSGQNGGDLGWFGKGQMVPEFEKAVFGGKIGEIIGPVKTSYGFHIIKVHQKSKSVRIAVELSNPVKVSSQTREEIYNAANDFAYILSKGNDFEKEAELMKYQVLETPSFNSKSEYVPGVGMNKALVDFAFENKLNSVSESYRILGGYVVAKISDVVNEGVKKFDEVKESLKPLVVREKKMELMKKRAEEMRKKIPAGESLSYLTKLDSTLVITNTGSFGYGQFVGGNVGRDFDFNFASFKLKPGQISNPVKGQRGYYLIQLLSKTDFDKNAYEMQKTSLRNQLLQEKKSMFFNQWLANLKKNAKIEDHRHKYYR